MYAPSGGFERLRLVLLQRRSVVAALHDVDRVGRLEEVRVGLEHGVVHLAQRADVVDHPEAAAMRRRR